MIDEYEDVALHANLVMEMKSNTNEDKAKRGQFKIDLINHNSNKCNKESLLKIHKHVAGESNDPLIKLSEQTIKTSLIQWHPKQ